MFIREAKMKNPLAENGDVPHESGGTRRIILLSLENFPTRMCRASGSIFFFYGEG
jgi:hypothetical protein